MTADLLEPVAPDTRGGVLGEATIVVVDDLPVVVRGLDEILGAHPCLRLVGEASTYDDAFELTRELRPDIVVVPVRLGGSHGGMSLCRRIKEHSGARVVLFTSFTRRIDLILARAVGADAVVSRTAPAHAVVAAIEAVGRGAHPVVLRDAASAPGALPLHGGTHLTPREIELLELMAGPHSNEEIAETLVIEVSTVKTHVRSILRKLGVASRRELFIDISASRLAKT